MDKLGEMGTLSKKQMAWTPRSIKRLPCKRTLSEFGALLRAPKNTVWRWEAGRSQPNEIYAERLSELARRERFSEHWRLAGSMTLLGDLESAKAEIAAIFRRSMKRTARQLAE